MISYFTNFSFLYLDILELWKLYTQCNKLFYYSRLLSVVNDVIYCVESSLKVASGIIYVSELLGPANFLRSSNCCIDSEHFGTF